MLNGAVQCSDARHETQTWANFSLLAGPSSSARPLKPNNRHGRVQYQHRDPGAGAGAGGAGPTRGGGGGHRDEEVDLAPAGAAGTDTSWWERSIHWPTIVNLTGRPHNEEPHIKKTMKNKKEKIELICRVDHVKNKIIIFF